MFIFDRFQNDCINLQIGIKNIKNLELYISIQFCKTNFIRTNEMVIGCYSVQIIFSYDVHCLEDVEESVEHLFFDCHSAACRWFALGITWNDHLNIHQKIQAAKLDFAQPFFMEIFMIGAWYIWNERDDFIFNGKPPCLAAWKSAFKAQVSEHLIRIKASLHPSILLWLQAL
jgi:hypothetical protein